MKDNYGNGSICSLAGLLMAKLQDLITQIRRFFYRKKRSILKQNNS